MIKPTLVIMAAGMGSRYGGLKQIEPVGPYGEKIIDYSIYDAVEAGFGKVVFIIKEEIEKEFREAIGKSIEKAVETAYVYQRVDDIPAGFSVPEGRVKPWGTGHAVLSSRYIVDMPFAVINADDFYGRSSFKLLGRFLQNAADADGVYDFCMVGFKLENTLTENGYVARGVCVADENGFLKEINERTRIKKFSDAVKYAGVDEEWKVIPQGSIVSMNIWGFTPGIFNELGDQFPRFLESNRDNILKAEFFLPEAVNGSISAGKARVKVLPSQERWYGVTYREDRTIVKEAISVKIANGIYPKNLWER